MIGSMAMLFGWLSERRGDPTLGRVAETIDRAIDACVALPQHRTADLGGPLGTQAFASRVVQEIESAAEPYSDEKR